MHPNTLRQSKMSGGLMKKSAFRKALANALAMAMFVSMTAGLTACAGSGSGSAQMNLGSGNGAVDPNAQYWNAVDTKGFVAPNAPSPFGNVQIISIDKTTETLSLMIPLPVNPFGGAMISSPVPEVPGAVVGITQDSSGKWYLTYTMPLSFLLKGIQYQNPATLPNGNPLPQVPGGELPSLAGHVQNGKINFYIYGSVLYFALFVPTPGFNPFVTLTYPIQNSSGTKILGYVSTVPATATANGGIYVALIFPPELQRLLDNVFN
jgi:hypothetical protein